MLYRPCETSFRAFPFSFFIIITVAIKIDNRRGLINTVWHKKDKVDIYLSYNVYTYVCLNIVNIICLHQN